MQACYNIIRKIHKIALKGNVLLITHIPSLWFDRDAQSGNSWSGLRPPQWLWGSRQGKEAQVQHGHSARRSPVEVWNRWQRLREREIGNTSLQKFFIEVATVSLEMLYIQGHWTLGSQLYARWTLTIQTTSTGTKKSNLVGKRNVTPYYNPLSSVVSCIS